MDQAHIPVKTNIAPIKAASGKPTSVVSLFDTSFKHLEGRVNTDIPKLNGKKNKVNDYERKPGTPVSLALANGEHPELHAGDLPKPVAYEVGNSPKINPNSVAGTQKGSEVHDLTGFLCISSSTQEAQENGLHPAGTQLFAVEVAATGLA